jgi:hypothetical protein
MPERVPAAFIEPIGISLGCDEAKDVDTNRKIR